MVSLHLDQFCRCTLLFESWCTLLFFNFTDFVKWVQTVILFLLFYFLTNKNIVHPYEIVTLVFHFQTQRSVLPEFTNGIS